MATPAFLSAAVSPPPPKSICAEPAFLSSAVSPLLPCAKMAPASLSSESLLTTSSPAFLSQESARFLHIMLYYLTSSTRAASARTASARVPRLGFGVVTPDEAASARVSRLGLGVGGVTPRRSRLSPLTSVRVPTPSPRTISNQSSLGSLPVPCSAVSPTTTRLLPHRSPRPLPVLPYSFTKRNYSSARVFAARRQVEGPFLGKDNPVVVSATTDFMITNKKWFLRTWEKMGKKERQGMVLCAAGSIYAVGCASYGLFMKMLNMHIEQKAKEIAAASTSVSQFNHSGIQGDTRMEKRVARTEKRVAQTEKAIKDIQSLVVQKITLLPSWMSTASH